MIANNAQLGNYDKPSIQEKCHTNDQFSWSTNKIEVGQKEYHYQQISELKFNEYATGMNESENRMKEKQIFDRT